jgi:hypothetical protein
LRSDAKFEEDFVADDICECTARGSDDGLGAGASGQGDRCCGELAAVPLETDGQFYERDPGFEYAEVMR